LILILIKRKDFEKINFYENLEIDLSELLSMDVMAPILANKNVQEKLINYLPESEVLPKSEQELRNTLTTPQFKKVWLI
jgi:hypothetical protein